MDGEGISGVLTDQADAWFYKRNLGGSRFGPLERVAAKPSLAALSGGRQQLAIIRCAACTSCGCNAMALAAWSRP